MSKLNIFEAKDRETISDSLTQVLRTGSQRLIYQAVQIELKALLAANTHRLTTDDKAAVVRNGYQPEREILTGIGRLGVKLPRPDRRTASRSVFIQPWCRRMFARVDLWSPPCPGYT